VCAGKQGAEAFWAMRDRLFATTSEWGSLENPAEKFKEYAAELKLDGTKFATCVDTRETAAEVQAQQDMGTAKGVSGTPAFYVNDWFLSGAYPFEGFQEVIEKALTGQHPPPTPTPLPEGKTIFDANPERAGYTFGGDAYQGSPDAPLALVAFVDFSSADNATFVVDAWPGLAKDYLDTNKVRLVIKDFPAPDVASAFPAAVAVECAGQQGNFWALYDLLFEKQAEWTRAADIQSALQELAGEAGLTEADFVACMNEGTVAEKVTADQAIALQNSFPPAPVFFLFSATQGGYAPAETLRESIDELLAQ
jgi:protein-disulfide isomerase